MALKGKSSTSEVIDSSDYYENGFVAGQIHFSLDFWNLIGILN
jgi:hypothetical protein